MCDLTLTPTHNLVVNHQDRRMSPIYQYLPSGCNQKPLQINLLSIDYSFNPDELVMGF